MTDGFKSGGRAFPEAFDGTGGPRRKRQEAASESETPPVRVVAGTDVTPAGEEERPNARKPDDSPKAARRINEIFDELDKINAKRRELNAEAGAKMNELAALGLRKDTARYLLKMRGWNEDERAEFDLSESVIRRAIGLPRQADMFEQ